MEWGIGMQVTHAGILCVAVLISTASRAAQLDASIRSFPADRSASAAPWSGPAISDPQWDGTSPARIQGLLAKLASAKNASLRGAAEAKLFRDIAPSVVMVVTNDGLGTGTVISDDGKVLTSWHVVRGAVDIGIIFKP